MLTEDYITRIIQQAVAALAEAIGLRESGRFEEALQVVQAGLEGFFGIPARLLYQMDTSSTLDILTSEGEVDLARVSVAASLFSEAGTLYDHLRQQENADTSYLRALELNLEQAFDDIDTVNEDVNKDISDQYDYLRGRLSLETCNGCFYYFQTKGQIHRALSALDEYLLLTNADPEVVKEACDFYRSLLNEPDTVLKQSGFSHQLIKDRIEQISC